MNAAESEGPGGGSGRRPEELRDGVGDADARHDHPNERHAGAADEEEGCDGHRDISMPTWMRRIDPTLSLAQSPPTRPRKSPSDRAA